MTMITPSYLGETIEYSSLHACRSTLEDPTERDHLATPAPGQRQQLHHLDDERPFAFTLGSAQARTKLPVVVHRQVHRTATIGWPLHPSDGAVGGDSMPDGIAEYAAQQPDRARRPSGAALTPTEPAIVASHAGMIGAHVP